MTTYLTELFGKGIQEYEYQFPAGTPNYLRLGFHAEKVVWEGKACILFEPVMDGQSFSALKKQLTNAQKLTDLPCVLKMDHITPFQRKSLITEKIPFIVEKSQAYLPFWGAVFAERYKSIRENGNKLAPAAQLVFLYLYYFSSGIPMNQTALAGQIGISKSTCTRAVQDLEGRKLLVSEEKGVSKFLCLSCEKEEFLRKGYSLLQSPILRRIYVSSLPEELQGKTAGIQALSEISMISSKKTDSGTAVCQRDARQIPEKNIISQDEFDETGGRIVEVWKYDPSVLAKGDRVDDLSLLLSLEKNADERIQMALDPIRSRYGIQTEMEECE